MKTLVAVGRFVHKERKKQKLSMAKLSEKAFGHTNYANLICKLENAKSESVTFDSVDKVLTALGYPLKDLFLAN